MRARAALASATAAARGPASSASAQAAPGPNCGSARASRGDDVLPRDDDRQRRHAVPTRLLPRNGPTPPARRRGRGPVRRRRGDSRSAPRGRRQPLRRRHRLRPLHGDLNGHRPRPRSSRGQARPGRNCIARAAPSRASAACPRRKRQSASKYSAPKWPGRRRREAASAAAAAV